MLRAFGASDKGAVRATNEDQFAIDESLELCVVADGMGGHNAGEVASRMAVSGVVEFVGRVPRMHWPAGFDASLSEEANLLRTAIHLANVKIFETASRDGQYAGMGTTIVVSLVTGSRLTVAHVGDSRLYLATAHGIRQVTRDDSWLATVLAQDPDADPAVLRNHPMRNALTNVVGARPRTDVHIAEERLTGESHLLLTTDGVHGVLSDGQLEQLVRRARDLPALAADIVSAAIAAGSRDNCTAVIARYTPD